MRKSRLMTPGPTPVHPDAAAILGSPQPHHRTADFKAVVARTRQRLAEVFRTSGEVLVLTSSGTGAMEAALVSLTRPGESIIVVDSGKFGNRWIGLAEAHGRKAVVLKPEERCAIQPQQVAEAVAANPEAAALCFAACESSTGVQADVEALAIAARGAGGDRLLIMADAITHLGAAPLETEGWDLDVVIGGAQKAFMIPPGLAFLALSARSIARLQSGQGGFYFDLSRELKAQRSSTTAWTPATGLIAALDQALGHFLEAGMEEVWRATGTRAEMTRAAFTAMGLTLYARHPAMALTAVEAPSGVDSAALVRQVEADFGVRLAGGQGDLKGRIFRVAHLGYIDMVDTLGTLGAVAATLRSMGAEVQAEAGLQQAMACMQATTSRQD